MKDKNTNNLKLKIIAVLFATGLWMISININDPYQSKDYPVSVQLLNMNNLTSAGKYVEVVNDSDEISVRVRGNRSVMDSFSASNIIATADLNDLDQNNRVPIKLSTIKTSGSKIESIRSNDTYLEVKVENIKRIQKSLEVMTKNVPEDGYMLGKVTTEQNALKISGPQSAVDMIDKAVVNFDLAGATDDVSMILPIELYDKEGNKIQDNRLTMSLKEVQCVATVLATKEVPLTATVKGTPTKGYAYTSEIICEPTNVVVAAKAGVLRGVKEIALKDVVDLAKATQELFGDTGNRIIGERHGEKLYETLLTEEEAAKAIDMGGYYRVPADNRDLNYDKYFVEGRTEEKLLHQYNSHNTERLDIEGTIAKMKTTDYIKEELAKLER